MHKYSDTGTSTRPEPDTVISWLLDADVSIQYQVYRDLLDKTEPSLRERIAKEGWGAKLLAARNIKGHWGQGFYQPKWISSHYSLLELRYLEIDSDNEQISATLDMIIRREKGADGGINPSGTIRESDVCVNGMFLNYASFFSVPEEGLISIIDFIISQQLPDGGFNCHFNRSGARHSSLHSTLSVLEGIHEFLRSAYTYRSEELERILSEGNEFILQHHLFLSDHTGKIIDKKMLLLSWPSRWRYDILRALDYFRYSKVKYDKRMNEALLALEKKKSQDGTWPLQGRHPGKVHFEMEQAGRSSRWNTLRALRVLNHYPTLSHE